MDNVNHPSHYTYGAYETIDVIRNALTYDEFVGYCNGNVLKYVLRWRRKGGTEDLEKSIWYQTVLCETVSAGRDAYDAKWHPNERLED